MSTPIRKFCQSTAIARKPKSRKIHYITGSKRLQQNRGRTAQTLVGLQMPASLHMIRVNSAIALASVATPVASVVTLPTGFGVEATGGASCFRWRQNRNQP
jgi:hypothetical protein